jgi:monoamine oxidase
MEQEIVIIVGAGVAGLMAAKELAGRYKVIVLEANDVAGGRIVTIANGQFLHPVEAGAEFIHGNTPLTLSLLKEAGVEYHAVGGDMMHLSNGKWVEQDEMIIGWNDVMHQMNALKEDMTIAVFLERYFADDKYGAVRKSIQKFAEGFDLADTSKASVFALRDEWEHEDEEQQRVKGGYGLLARYLLQQCEKGNCSIHTSCVVKNIRWKKNEVQVTTADDKTFWGNKIIVTVPLGILQADNDQCGAISFEPALDNYKQAARLMGFGTVIKIMLQFKEAFWNKKKKDIGFVISDQLIPTWWTQAPADWPLLTGWLGGPPVQVLINESDETILSQALQSLSVIFDMSLPGLQQLLTASHIANWSHAPFSLGAYSYNTLHSAKSVALLNRPVQHTIFFAGEALYTGPYPGTVEAALATGVLVSDKLISGE